MGLALYSNNTDAGLIGLFFRKHPGAVTPEPVSATNPMRNNTSSTNGLCARCGGRTTRSRLCRDCGRDEHREAELRADTDAPPDPTYECVECAARFATDSGLDPCPECGSLRHLRVTE